MTFVASVRSYFHQALRDEWDGLDRMYRDLRLADLFTILNALCGMAALFFATRGDFNLAVTLVLVGVIMDGVDGAVARLGKGNGPVGPVMDTLADAVTFVTTSAVVAFLAITWNAQENLIERALVGAPLAFYVVCGLLRLARFETLREDGKARQYFSGIPTPAAAVTILSLVLVQLEPWVVSAVSVYIGILMVSRIRFPKLRGWLAVASLAVLLALLATFQNPDLQRLFAILMLVFMSLYVVTGPFYVLARYGVNFPKFRGLK